MKFLPRAATFAAVTFCAGALANAATLNLSPLPQQEAKLQATVQSAPAQVQNVLASQQVPAPQAAVEQQEADDDNDTSPEYATLSDAVAAQEDIAALEEDRDLRCLATGIYFEARSEPLSGQLAVADVILNRSTSGRFPGSVCSVVTQKGQFSFVRHGKLPTPPANAQWRRALAVAQVARKNLWESPAGDALYFHARYANANLGRASIATVGNHIFYR
ncbi:cell wall hydrolase [Sphingomonas sp. TDK1]|uniref:cell wall hydrolase n=1 Tax=Sphingomonas sp. TDK1 TaxID=453247 RepID=UPI0007D9CB70|nr:cell wall hydrolase [Sphingomonas sp. TDK1]OAN58152.1 cell wall hydrolase [Sphingomonas sp. TDK1]